jgi:hypothetical protein
MHILIKHTDVFETPRSATSYFDLLQRCGGDIPLNIFATVNALFSAGEPALQAQPSLEAELLNDSTKSRVQRLRRRVRAGRDSLIFTRASGLLNLKVLLSVRRDKPPYRATAVGGVALHANDYVDISLNDADPEIFAVQNMPVWEIYNPREVAPLLARYYFVTQEMFGTDDRIVKLFEDEFGTKPADTPIDGLTFDDYLALLFGIYTRASAGVRDAKTSIIEFAEHGDLLKLSTDSMKEFTASRVADEQSFMSYFGELTSAADLAGKLGDPLWALDFSAFRERPLLRLRDGRVIVVDVQYLIENASVGAFWNVFRRMSDAGRKSLLSYWGGIFESYVRKQLEAHRPTDSTLLFGANIDGCEVDGILTVDGVAVVFESKAGMIPNSAKCSRNVQIVRKAIERKFISNATGKQKGVRQLARSARGVASNNSITGKVEKVYPVLVVDEVALQTAGINTYLATRLDQLVEGSTTIAPLAVVTVDELETILPYIAAGDLTWQELLDARAVGASVTAKPVNTTFYEIAHARRFQQRENAILSPAAKRLAAMLREKYRHLEEQ